MKRPEVRKYLFDAAEACDVIAEFVAEKTFADYERNRMLRSAVERQFEIVGEALAGLLRVAPELEQRISDARRIIAFRNRLSHGYAVKGDNHYRLMVEHFADVTQGNATLRYGIEHSIGNLKAIEALYQSARAGGRPVAVPASPK